ncbi:MAG: hypothetical protein AAF495_15715 [Pseudomonadota bacterium]
MRPWLCLVALVAALIAAPAAQAQSEPADSNIKAALYDIEKAEQQLKGLTPSRKANIKRLQNSLALTEERLAASPNQDHASWIEANQRLQAVKAGLAELAGGGSGGATTAQPAQPATDPTLRRLQSELNLIGKQVSGLKAGDHGVAARHVADTMRVGQELAVYANRDDPAWQEAAALYGQINNHLVEVMAPSWQSDLMGTAEYIGKMTALDYMDAGKVGYVNERLNNLFNSMQAFQNPQNPNIQAITQALIQVGTAFDQRVQQAAAEQDQLGDYAGQLEAVAKRTQALKIPKPLTAPTDEAAVQAFVSAIKAAQSQIDQDLAYLQSIDGKAPLTVEQGNTFREARAVLTHSKPSDIKQAVELSTYAMDHWVINGERVLNGLENVDPNDSDDQANRLLGQGRFEEYMGLLNDGLTAVKVAAAYDAAIGRTNGADRAAQQRRFEEGMAAFKEKRQVALRGKRMPEAQSEDPALLEAAAEVLARPQYGFEHERLVINYDVQRKERTEGTVDYGAASTEITATHYVWDEFQATTAEKVGGETYLFVNEFHFYHSGDSTVPTGKWILHDRFQSSQILPENVGK